MGRIKKALKGARNRPGLGLEGIKKRTPEAVRAAQLRHNKSLKKEKYKQQVNKRNAKALQGHEARTISVDEPLTKVGTTVVGVRETTAGGSKAKPPPKAIPKINEQRKVKEAKEKKAMKAGKKARKAEAKKKAEKLAKKEAKEAEDALANLAVKEAADKAEKEAAEKAEKEA